MILELVDYKEFLNVTSSDTDDILETIAEASEKEVERYLKFDFESESKIEYYDGSDRSVLVLDSFPVTAITSISYWDGSDWVALTTDDYNDLRIKNQSSVYLDGYVFTKGTMNYKVVYTAGYTTIPTDIQLVIKKVTKINWDSTPLGRNSLGLNTISNSAGVQSNLNINRFAKEDVLKELEEYRHVNA